MSQCVEVAHFSNAFAPFAHIIALSHASFHPPPQSELGHEGKHLPTMICVHLCSSAMFHVHARQFADAFLAKITDLTGHITPRAPNLSFSSFGCPGTGSGSPESDKCNRSRSGGSLGLIACFPQTLPAKKGDSMGWVNIKKVGKKNTDLFLLFEPNFFWVSNSYPYSLLSLIDFKTCLIGSL